MSSSALFYLPYLPPTGWMRAWVQHPHRMLEHEENFVKSTCRNRCHITGANGRQTLTIPIHGGRDHHQLYKEVRIANTTPWQRQHWQAIRSAYGSAPFYEHYAHRFENFYEKPYEYLYHFNLDLLQGVLGALRLGVQNIEPLQQTTVYEKTPTGITDLRLARLTGTDTSTEPYNQVFADRHGFVPNLCILDLLFNEGPQAVRWLMSDI